MNDTKILNWGSTEMVFKRHETGWITESGKTHLLRTDEGTWTAEYGIHREVKGTAQEALSALCVRLWPCAGDGA